MSELSHVDGSGKARMVDVGGKAAQRRIARATGRIEVAAATAELIRQNQLEKGDVLAVARIAGIQAAKRTSELIPLCHPLKLSHVQVDAEVQDAAVAISCMVQCVDRTGVEMEALTGVSVALLTIYDMCKAVDQGMRIGEIVLEEKTKYDL
jgi:cyclic pyranopterin phosphate synthase